MGIDLVQLLLLHHAAGLSGRAFKVLCKMAATALDTPNGKGQTARLYFAGEGPLAHVLYGRGPDLWKADETTGERVRVYTSNELREVRRVLKELRDAGLIESMTDKATRGHAQSFRLALGQIAHPNEGESAHPNEGESAPLSRGNLPTPRTDRGTNEDSSQDTLPPASASTTGHAREGQDDADEIQRHHFVGEPGDDCTNCGHGYADRRRHHGRGAA